MFKQTQPGPSKEPLDLLGRFHSLPSWARWVLYLPVVLITPLITGVATSILVRVGGAYLDLGSSGGESQLPEAVGRVASVATLVYLGAELPPRWNRTFGWFWFALAVFEETAVLLPFVTGSNGQGSLWDAGLIGALVMSGLGIFVAFKAFKMAHTIPPNDYLHD